MTNFLSLGKFHHLLRSVAHGKKNMIPTPRSQKANIPLVTYLKLPLYLFSKAKSKAWWAIKMAQWVKASATKHEPTHGYNTTPYLCKRLSGKLSKGHTKCPIFYLFIRLHLATDMPSFSRLFMYLKLQLPLQTFNNLGKVIWHFHELQSYPMLLFSLLPVK